MDSVFYFENPFSIYHHHHAEYDLRHLISRRDVEEKFSSMTRDLEAHYTLLRSIVTPRCPVPPYPIYDNPAEHRRACETFLNDLLNAQRHILRAFFLDTPFNLVQARRLLISRRVFRAIVQEYRYCSRPMPASNEAQSGAHHLLSQKSNDSGTSIRSQPALSTQRDLHLSFLRTLISNFRNSFHLLLQHAELIDADTIWSSAFNIFNDLQRIMMQRPGCRETDGVGEDEFDLGESMVTEMKAFLKECCVGDLTLLPTMDARQLCFEVWLLVTGLKGGLVDVMDWILASLQAHFDGNITNIRPNVVRKMLVDFLGIDPAVWDSTAGSRTHVVELLLQLMKSMNQALEYHIGTEEGTTFAPPSASVKSFYCPLSNMEAASGQASALQRPLKLIINDNSAGISILASEAVHGKTYLLSTDGHVFLTSTNVNRRGAYFYLESYQILEIKLEESRGLRRSPFRPHVVQISANNWQSTGIHVLALTADGAVYSSGSGENGALGRGTANYESTLRPVLVLGGGKDSPVVVGVSAGGRHSAAVTREGALYTWGSNDCGQLGFCSQTVYMPMKVEGLSSVRQVSCSTAHTVVLLEDSTVWTLGCRRTPEQASVMSMEARAVRRKVVLPLAPVNARFDHYCPVRVTGAGDLSLILTENQQLLVEGLENRVGRLGTGVANALMTRLRGGGSGPPIGNSRTAVVMETFQNVRSMAAGPTTIVVMTHDNLVYQVDSTRFTNFRIRHLDKDMITHASVSDTHFLAWSRDDDEEEEADITSLAHHLVQRSTAGYLAPRVIGEPTAALETLARHLRDANNPESGLNAMFRVQPEIAHHYLEQLLRMFSNYLRCLGRSLDKDAIAKSKMDWLAVLLDLYQNGRLPEAVKTRIHSVLENPAHSLCPAVRDCCPLAFNLVRDIHQSHVPPGGCWWENLPSSNSLFLLILLRGAASNEGVMYMVREKMSDLELFVQWIMDLQFSLAEWLVHNQVEGDSAEQSVEAVDVFSAYLHLAFKHVMALCIDTGEDLLQDRDSRPNRPLFSALLSRLIRQLLDLSERLIAATTDALIVVTAASPRRSGSRERVRNIVTVLKSSSVGQILFFVVIGLMQAPLVWKNGSSEMAEGLKGLLKAMSELIDALPGYAGLCQAERQELDWPLFARHGENVSLWSISLTGEGSESPFFWIFELQRVVGFMLGRLMWWCLTEEVPSPPPEDCNDKWKRWLDKGLLINGLRPEIFEPGGIRRQEAELELESLAMKIDSTLDTSLTGLLDDDNFGKLMMFARRMGWTADEEAHRVVDVVTNCVLTVALELSAQQAAMKAFDPESQDPAPALRKVFQSVFSVRYHLLSADHSLPSSRKNAGETVWEDVAWDSAWTATGPDALPAILHPEKKVLLRCLFLQRVFGPTPLTWSLQKMVGEEKKLFSVSTVRRSRSSERSSRSNKTMSLRQRSQSLDHAKFSSTQDGDFSHSLQTVKRRCRRLDFNRRQQRGHCLRTLLAELVDFLTDTSTTPGVAKDDCGRAELLALALQTLIGDEEEQREDDDDEEEERMSEIHCNDVPWGSSLPHSVSLQVMAAFCGLDPIEEDFSLVPGLLNEEDVAAARFHQRQELTVRTHCMIASLLQRLEATLAYSRRQRGGPPVGQHRLMAVLLHALSLPFDCAMLELILHGGLLRFLVEAEAAPEVMAEHRLRHGSPDNLQVGTQMMGWMLAEIVVMSASLISISTNACRHLYNFLAHHLARFLKSLSGSQEWHSRMLPSLRTSLSTLEDPAPLNCPPDVVNDALGSFLSLLGVFLHRAEHRRSLAAHKFWPDALMLLLLRPSLCYPVRHQAAFLLRLLLNAESGKALAAPYVRTLREELLRTAGTMVLAEEEFWAEFLTRGREYVRVQEAVACRPFVSVSRRGPRKDDELPMEDLPPVFDPRFASGCVLSEGGEMARSLRAGRTVVGAVRMSSGMWEVQIELCETGTDGVALGLCLSPPPGPLPPILSTVITYETRSGNIRLSMQRNSYAASRSGTVVTLLLDADLAEFGVRTGDNDTRWPEMAVPGSSWNLVVELAAEGDTVRIVSQRRLPSWRWSSLHPAVSFTELPADPFVLADQLIDTAFFLSSPASLTSKVLETLQSDEEEDPALYVGVLALLAGLSHGAVPGFVSTFRLPGREEETVHGVLLSVFPHKGGSQSRTGTSCRCRVQPLIGSREEMTTGRWARLMVPRSARRNARPLNGEMLAEADPLLFISLMGKVRRFASKASFVAPEMVDRRLERMLDDDIFSARMQDGLASEEEVTRVEETLMEEQEPVVRFPDFLREFLLMKTCLLGLSATVCGAARGKERWRHDPGCLAGLETVLLEVTHWSTEVSPILRFQEPNSEENVDIAVLVSAHWTAEKHESQNDSLVDLWYDSWAAISSLRSEYNLNRPRTTSLIGNMLGRMMTRANRPSFDGPSPRMARERGPLEHWLERARMLSRNRQQNVSSPTTAPSQPEQAALGSESRLSRLHRRCMELQCDLLLDQRRMTPVNLLRQQNAEQDSAKSPRTNSRTQHFGPTWTRTQEGLSRVPSAAAGRPGIFQQLEKIRKMPEACPADLLHRLYTFKRISVSRGFLAKLLQELPHWPLTLQSRVLKATGMLQPSRLVRALKLLEWHGYDPLSGDNLAPCPTVSWTQLMAGLITKASGVQEATSELLSTLRSELHRLQVSMEMKDITSEETLVHTSSLPLCEFVVDLNFAMMEAHYADVRGGCAAPTCASCVAYHRFLDLMLKTGMSPSGDLQRRGAMLTPILRLLNTRYSLSGRARKTGRWPVERIFGYQDETQTTRVMSPIQRIFVSGDGGRILTADSIGQLHIRTSTIASAVSEELVFRCEGESAEEGWRGIGRMAVTADCLSVAAASGQTVNVWNSLAVTSPAILSHAGCVVTTMTWVEGEEDPRLLMGRSDGHVWSYRRGEGLRWTGVGRDDDGVSAMSCPCVGAPLAVGFKSGVLTLQHGGRTTEVWGPGTQEVGGAQVRGGRLMAFRRGSEEVFVFCIDDLSDNEVPVVAAFRHSSPVSTVLWLPVECRASPVVGAGGQDGQVSVWDPESSRSWRLTNGHSASITAITALDSRVSLMATGCAEGVVCVWANRSLLVFASCGRGSVTSLSLASQGLLMSWAHTGEIRTLPRSLLSLLQSRCHRVMTRALARLVDHGLVDPELVPDVCPSLLPFVVKLGAILKLQREMEWQEICADNRLTFSSSTIALSILAVLLGVVDDKEVEQQPQKMAWLERFHELINVTNKLVHRSEGDWRYEEDVALVEWYREHPDHWDHSAHATAWLWGCGNRGQLGAEVASSKTPLRLPTNSIQEMLAGHRVTYFTDRQGHLHVVGDEATAYTQQNVGHVWNVRPKPDLIGLRVVQVACPILPRYYDGPGHVLALTSVGDVLAWGEGARGRLGLGFNDSVRRPRRVAPLTGVGVVRIACGPACSSAVTGDGRVWFWGAHDACPEKGFATDLLLPQIVAVGAAIRDIAMRFDGGLMVTTDGSVLSYYHNIKRPVSTPTLQGCAIDRVFTTDLFSVAWSRTSGLVYSWGQAGYVGRSDFVHLARPVSESRVLDVSVNWDSAMILVDEDDKRRVLGWGAIGKCDLGEEIARTRYSLVEVQEFSSEHGPLPNRLSCGFNHAVVWTTPSQDESKQYGADSLLSLPSLHLPSTSPPSSVLERPPESCLRRLRFLAHWTNFVESNWQLLCFDSWLVRACQDLPVVSGLVSGLVGGQGQLRELLTRPVLPPLLARIISVTTTAPRVSSAQTAMRLARPREGLEAPPIFAQMANEAVRLPASVLRIAPGGVAWRVRLVGEAADDVGGVYEDMMSAACEELRSAALRVLLPTPDTRACSDPDFLLHPQAQSPHLHALGLFIGLAIRSQKPLALRLAASVWRRLAGLEVGPEDVEQEDAAYVRSMRSLANDDAEDEGLSPDNFQDILPDARFVASSVDGRPVTVAVDGEFRRVEFHSRQEFSRAVLQFRAKEGQRPAQLLLEGLNRLLPATLLRLARPDELERAVCGEEDVKVASLRAIAKYSNYEETDAVVTWLWDFLEHCSSSERVRFLRFVSGRSRLPVDPRMVRQLFLIIRVGGDANVDELLPSAQTCFFQLRLPRYSSREILTSRLRYAIEHCRLIDTDNYMLNRNDVRNLPQVPLHLPQIGAHMIAVNMDPDEEVANEDEAWEDLGMIDGDDAHPLPAL